MTRACRKLSFILIKSSNLSPTVYLFLGRGDKFERPRGYGEVPTGFCLHPSALSLLAKNREAHSAGSVPLQNEPHLYFCRLCLNDLAQQLLFPIVCSERAYRQSVAEEVAICPVFEGVANGYRLLHFIALYVEF